MNTQELVKADHCANLRDACHTIHGAALLAVCASQVVQARMLCKHSYISSRNALALFRPSESIAVLFECFCASRALIFLVEHIKRHDLVWRDTSASNTLELTFICSLNALQRKRASGKKPWDKQANCSTFLLPLASPASKDKHIHPWRASECRRMSAQSVSWCGLLGQATHKRLLHWTVAQHLPIWKACRCLFQSTETILSCRTATHARAGAAQHKKKLMPAVPLLALATSPR